LREPQELTKAFDARAPDRHVALVERAGRGHHGMNLEDIDALFMAIDSGQIRRSPWSSAWTATARRRRDRTDADHGQRMPPPVAHSRTAGVYVEDSTTS